MWPFTRKTEDQTGLGPTTMEMVDGVARIDVRGQTCPGYLLSINKAVETLPPGTRAWLVVTYPPAAEDVRSWANVKGLQYVGLEEMADHWRIEIRT